MIILPTPSLIRPGDRRFYLGAAKSSLGRGGKGGGAAGITLDDYSGIIDEATTTHTLGASADYALVICSVESTGTPTVTFGGVAMTAGPTSIQSPTQVRSFYLLAASLPAPGSVSVVRSTASGWNLVWTLIGAAQQAPSRNSVAAAAAATQLVCQLTSVASGSFIAGACNWNGNTVPSLSGVDTQRVSDNESGQGQSCVGGDNFPTSAGTVTHTYNGPNARCAALMLELEAA